MKKIIYIMGTILLLTIISGCVEAEIEEVEYTYSNNEEPKESIEAFTTETPDTNNGRVFVETITDIVTNTEIVHHATDGYQRERRVETLHIITTRSGAFMFVTPFIFATLTEGDTVTFDRYTYIGNRIMDSNHSGYKIINYDKIKVTGVDSYSIVYSNDSLGYRVYENIKRVDK